MYWESFLAGLALTLVLGIFFYLYLKKSFQKSLGEKVEQKTQLLEERLKIQGDLLNKEQKDREIALQEKDALQKDIQNYAATLSSLKTRLEEERKHSQEKIQLLDDAKNQLSQQFKNLAGEIFDEKNQKFTHQSQTHLEQLLKPFREQLHQFRQKVEQTHSQDVRERASLSTQIKNLQELNKQISEEAVNLTKALKGQTKTQGTWGEMILERVLEKSGLQKGREYQVQSNQSTEEGKRYQPDVIIHLPESRELIIDSKVSLVAYEQFCTVEGEEEKVLALKNHVLSVRTHIKGLAEKAYQNLPGVNTLDFVFLFIPVEGALAAALQGDADLFSQALEKNIVLVGPATLLATLRTVENLWRQERQSRNVAVIVDRAGKMYDKFVNFVTDIEDIGLKLNQVSKSYDKARNKLFEGRGNLIRQFEDLKDLGVKGTKDLPKADGENGELGLVLQEASEK